MLRKEFEEYYNKIVLPYAYELKKVYEEHDVELRVNKANEKLFEDMIFQEYLLQRTKLREFYGQKPIDMLDNHKVSACLTYAIIRAQLFAQFVGDDRPRDKMNLREFHRVNEQLALYCGISVLFAYNKINAKQEDKIYAIFNVDEVYYPCNVYPDSPADVISKIVRSLYYARVDNSLSVPLLALVFFYIESYHAQILMSAN